MKHSDVILRFLFPSDEQSPKTIQPRVRSFDHPYPRLKSGNILLYFPRRGSFYHYGFEHSFHKFFIVSISPSTVIERGIPFPSVIGLFFVPLLSWLHASIASPNLFFSQFRTPSNPFFTSARIILLHAIPEICRAPCLKPLKSVARRSTGNQCEGYKKSHPSLFYHPFVVFQAFSLVSVVVLGF